MDLQCPLGPPADSPRSRMGAFFRHRRGAHIGALPDLGPIHVVSYKVKKRGSLNWFSRRARPRSSDLQCAGGRIDPRRMSRFPEGEQGGAGCGGLCTVGQIRISVSDDASSVRACRRSAGALAPSRGSGTRSPSPDHEALRDLEGSRERRAAADNALWFLWIES